MKTPKSLGHRAAAQGDTTACPFPSGSADEDEWVQASASVELHRRAGRDPGGHTPPPPHLCTRDGTKVCNCCSTCTAACRAEDPLPEALPTVDITKVLWALPRIAHALEHGREADVPCTRCGCTAVRGLDVCPVCGGPV